MTQPYAAEIASVHEAAAEALQQQRFGDTERLCRELLKSAPRDAEAMFLYGVASLEQQKLEQGLRALQQTVLLEPEQPRYLAQFARCLSVAKADKQALKIAEQASRLPTEDPLVLDTLGCVYSRAGEHHKALQAFRQAAAKRPTEASFQFNLAASAKFTGDFAAAEQAYEAAIEQKPDHYPAHWALANLRRQTPEENHVERLTALLPAAAKDADGLLYLCHALAKEHEDLGDFHKAFSYWQQGNAAKRSILHYDFAEDARMFTSLRESFHSPLSGAAGYVTNEPLFVVGMPRTGTTLVDRILSSHSTVQSAGELRNLSVLIKRAAGSRSSRVLDTETIERSHSLKWATLGEQYLRSTRPGTGQSAHFIDKTPLNFLLLGHLCQALPNAKIVCLRRHPLDAIFSNFKQLFAVDVSYYDYAYSLEDTARYYVEFDRLIAHWDTIFPGRVLQVQYEEVVANQESETRRLLEFCALPWEDGCLSFERNAAPVATASAVQVRQPLYSRSVGRWRNYTAELEPARQLLEAAGIAID